MMVNVGVDRSKLDTSVLDSSYVDELRTSSLALTHRPLHAQQHCLPSIMSPSG